MREREVKRENNKIFCNFTHHLKDFGTPLLQDSLYVGQVYVLGRSLQPDKPDTISWPL